MSKYIIGGGIAGLIAAFYKPDYKLIADDIGGQMAQKGLGPRLLEVNDNSANLLDDLGYEVVDIKTAKVGYRYENRFHDTITPEYRRTYYLKSRNLPDSPDIVVPSSAMSDGKNEFKYFDIDWKDLINRLYEAVKDRVINGKVTKIDLKNKTLEIGGKKGLKYEKLISTIPAPVFCKLANIKPEVPFTSEKKVFIIVPANAVDIRDYTYVYYPEKHVEYHRITNLGRNRAAIEYTGNHFKSATLFGKWKHIAFSTKELPGAQITGGKLPDVPGVEFAGRYAEWNHDIKTDDLVGRFREVKEWDKTDF